MNTCYDCDTAVEPSGKVDWRKISQFRDIFSGNKPEKSEKKPILPNFIETFKFFGKKASIIPSYMV